MEKNRLIYASLIPLLFLIGNSPAPAPVTTDCQSIQHDISRSSSNDARLIKLMKNSICHIPTLEILNGKNITLDGENSTLIFSGNITGIHVGDNSKNISILNINIDYDPLPFTQGIINKINDGYFYFLIDKNYPPVDKNNNRVLIYDRFTKKLKIEGSTLYFKNFEIDADGKGGRIPIAKNYRARLQIGDFVAFRPRGNPAIRLDGLSRDIRLNNVFVLSSPGMGIMGRYLDGNNYVNVRIIPGPRPSGSSRHRLLSVNADGVNFAYTRKGPIIENSTIFRQGDDGINLHGLILGISSIHDFKNAIVLRPFGNDNLIERVLKPGDDVRFLANGNFHILGSTKIRKFRKIGSRIVGENDNLPNMFPRAFADGAKGGTFYDVSFVGNIPPGAAYLDIMSAASNGFIIKNNNISSNRGHGIVIGASNGVIMGNIISRTTHNSIIIGPNFQPWREGSWPSHVSIIGNNISDPCTDGLNGKKISEQSSIFIGGDSENNHNIDINKISVYGNIIEPCHNLWIKANGVNGISLLNNVFAKNNDYFSRKNCKKITINSVKNSKNYIFHGNKCTR